MFTLYHSPLACSLASRLALTEAGLPHEVVFVHTARGEQHGADYARVNPRGKVPALATPEGVLTESTAILPFIADSAPDKDLLPVPGTFERAVAQSWLSFLSSTVHASYTGIIAPQQYAAGTAEHAAIVEAQRARLAKALTEIDAHLAGREWMLDAFSLVDVYLLVFCMWRTVAGALPTMPALDAFQQRMLARPGYMPIVGEEMALRATA
jgi:glutathione S-transferase